MNAEHLHILQHALGLDGYGQPQNGYHASSDDEFPGCYRNHFVTSPTCADGGCCEALVSMGLMVKSTAGKGFLGEDCANYRVTAAGFDAMKKESPAKPRLSRSKQCYADYREVADCFHSFGSYLNYRTRQRRETGA